MIKISSFIYLSFFMIFVSLNTAISESRWTEDLNGEHQAYTYRVVDPKGAVRRAACPYTCEDSQIPKEHCKEWRSITHSLGGECYVQDLRISKDDVMPSSTKNEVRKSRNGYESTRR